MNAMRKIAILLPLLLAACGQSDSDPGPGGVTVGEARALDEAAAMLEEQRLPQDETVQEPAHESTSDTEANEE